MNYHTLNTYTLKSIVRDINKRLKRIITELDELREQKETINFILEHRGNNTDIDANIGSILVDPYSN